MSAELHPLSGPRQVIEQSSELFPAVLRDIPQPPERLYCVGNPAALEEGLAVVGARNATPYGIGCAKRFARIASLRGVTIISGGARGCDSVLLATQRGFPSHHFYMHCGFAPLNSSVQLYREI